jgi:hypothetical protein
MSRKREGRELQLSYYDDKPYMFNGLHKWDAFQREFKELTRLKELTGLIDFKCEFKDGMCALYRHETSSYFTLQEQRMCCCISCYGSSGYLHNEVVPVRLKRRYESYWTPTQGFWGRKEGCKLPRWMRSITCVQYNCHSDYKIRDSIHALGNAMRTINMKLKSMYSRRKEV